MEKRTTKGVSLKTMITYSGSGMFAKSFQGLIRGHYYMLFLTNVMLLPTAMAATIYTSMTLVNIVAMTLAGIMIDSIKLRWGKLRSWFLIGSILTSATVGLMFLKINITPAAYVIYAIAINFIYNLGHSFSWVAMRAIVAPMSGSTADATKLTTASELGSRISGLFSSLLMVAIIGLFKDSSQQYMVASYVMTIPVLVAIPFFMKMSKPYDNVDYSASTELKKKPAPQKITFKEMLRSFSRPAVCYYLAAAFACAQTSFFAVLLAYYTKYVLNNDYILGIAATVYSVGGFIGVSITPLLRKKFTNKQIYAWLTIIAAFPYLGIMLTKGNAVLFLVCRFINALVATPTSPVMVAIANDVADYNEMKGISNARAFVTSMMGTMIRVGALIASAVSSFGLAAVGFDAAKPMTDEILNAIVKLMGFGPAIVCIISGVIMMAYNVDENEIDEYRQEKMLAITK